MRPRFRCILAKMADDSLDDSGKTLEPKYLTKQTLFSVIGTSKSKGTGSLLFPCSSFKVDERAAGIGKGKGNLFALDHDFFYIKYTSPYKTTIISKSIKTIS